MKKKTETPEISTIERLKLKRNAPAQTHTAGGRKVSHFTMWMKWKQTTVEKVKKINGVPQKDLFGNLVKDDTYTYRGDDEMEYRLDAGFPCTNQLEVLNIIYTKKLGKFLECKIYNNHKSQAHSLIFHHDIDYPKNNGIVINNLAQALEELREQWRENKRLGKLKALEQ